MRRRHCTSSSGSATAPALTPVSRGDPRAKLGTLLARAKRAPIVIPTSQGPQQVTYADIVGLTLSDLFEPDAWAALAEFLQLAFVSSGSGSSTATAAAETAELPRGPTTTGWSPFWR